jgi:hypothetical protein
MPYMIKGLGLLGRAALLGPEKAIGRLWGLLWGLGVWQGYSRLLRDLDPHNLFNSLSNAAQPRVTPLNANGLIFKSVASCRFRHLGMLKGMTWMKP